MASLSEMRARLQQLNQRGPKKTNDLWKAKDEHVIRALPNPKGGDPFSVLVFHYELGETVLCPKANFGEECVVCDFCDVLKSWKTPAGVDKSESDRKTDFQLYRKIQPTERAFMRVIERQKDGSLSPEGPKWWSPGYTNINRLMEVCANTERQEALGLDPSSDEGLNVLFGLEKAYDIVVSYKKANNADGKGNKKNRDSVEIDFGLTPKFLSKSKAEVEKVLAACKDISDVYVKQSASDVKRIFDKFVGQGVKESAVDNSVSSKQEYAANTSETESIGGKSLEEAFDELSK